MLTTIPYFVVIFVAVVVVAVAVVAAVVVVFRLQRNDSFLSIINFFEGLFINDVTIKKIVINVWTFRYRFDMGMTHIIL